MKRMLELLSTAIPFLDSYPPWVKLFIAGWIIFTAVVIVLLLFFRLPDAKKAAEPIKQAATLQNSPNANVVQVGGNVIIQPPPRQSESDESMKTPPDTSKAKKKVIVESLDQLEHNSGLVDVSGIVPGYFELSIPPSTGLYSSTFAGTKENFKTHYFVSVSLAGIQNFNTLELQGRDVWFAVDASVTQYYVYESETNWTHWRPLPVEVFPINTLAIYHKERKVSVFLNNNYITTFTKYEPAKPGPIGVYFKANPKTGGRIHFQRLSIWEF